MIAFRDRTVREYGLDLLVHTNPEGLQQGLQPFGPGAGAYTRVMKTEALKQALDRHGFDAAFGGARRDEEKSRAKERILSFRSAGHGWDPRTSARSSGGSTTPVSGQARVCAPSPSRIGPSRDGGPTSRAEDIPVVPLYFAAEAARRGARRRADRDRRRSAAADAGRDAPPAPGPLPNTGLLPADRRRRIRRGEPSMRSSGNSPPPAPPSARARLIDSEEDAAMERKKREGYF